MDTIRITAKKSLGQNFLRSEKALNQIVTAGDISRGEIVLEIGPGEGVLTEKLIAAGATVIVVEKDDRLIPLLNKKFEKHIENKRLFIIHGDILDLDIKDIFSIIKLPTDSPLRAKQTSQITQTPYKVIANIPYYITGLLMRYFLETEYQPSRMVLLVQKEVAERIITRDKKESILSLSVKLFGTPKIIDRVPRGAFVPAPNVDSAILLIENISNEKIKAASIAPQVFFETIKKSFSQKRKQIGGTLGIKDADLQHVFGIDASKKTTPITEKTRPEDIDTDDWLKIVQYIQRKI